MLKDLKKNMKVMNREMRDIQKEPTRTCRDEKYNNWNENITEINSILDNAEEKTNELEDVIKKLSIINVETTSFYLNIHVFNGSYMKIHYSRFLIWMGNLSKIWIFVIYS